MDGNNCHTGVGCMVSIVYDQSTNWEDFYLFGLSIFMISSGN